jgi:hypothetical protein
MNNWVDEEELQKIVDRIRACLALGDSEKNSSPEEVETALRMAKLLMAKYSLSMDDIAQDSSGNGITVEGMAERSGAPKWEYSLCRVCNELFDTRSYIQVGDKRYRKKLMFVGYPADVAISVEVYKLLILELRNMGNKWIAENLSEENTQKMNLTRKHKYLYGIVITLIRRAKEMATKSQEDVHTEYSGMACGLTRDEEKQMAGLVLRKKKEVDEWMETNLELTPARRTDNSKRNVDAYASGLVDGKKVRTPKKRKEVREARLLTA